MVTHSWATAGDFEVVLRAFNDTFPAGVSATQTVRVLVNPIHYVRQNNPSPSAPYLSWVTAATNIQDAVDAAYVGGSILVSNGVYSAGMGVVSATTNRVALSRPMTLESVGGPAVTLINGLKTMRGVYLAEGTSMRGFTVTNCSTSGSGGGVFCEASSVVVSNCVLSGNSSGNGGGIYNGILLDCVLKGNTAPSGGGALVASLERCELLNNTAAGYGGGASSCALNHCVLSGNYAYSPAIGGGGGGAYSSTLNNCLVISNAAPIWGGGAYASTLNNCTVVYNYGGQRGAGIFEGTANNSILYGNYMNGNVIENFGARYWWQVTLNHCGTTPMPGSGGGNFTNAPLFMNPAAGDFRLQSDSPGINVGNNGYVGIGSTDLDGNRRIVNGIVDVGAYEFVPPDLADFFQWLADYGLPVDGSADYTDDDLDLANNWEEWKAWTDPTDEFSVLRMLRAEPQSNGTVVSWQSVSNQTYLIERRPDLGDVFSLVQSNIVGRAGTTTHMDTNAVGDGPFLYRVGVR
jgi:hypothetical protein